MPTTDDGEQPEYHASYDLPACPTCGARNQWSGTPYLRPFPDLTFVMLAVGPWTCTNCGKLAPSHRIAEELTAITSFSLGQQHALRDARASASASRRAATPARDADARADTAAPSDAGPGDT
jgi:transposase